MAVAGPTGPVMSREEVDRALTRLGSEYEAIEESLLALEDHSGRRLLEGAELVGRTKERWDAAAPAIPLLWAHFETYGTALRAAREVRARRCWPSPGDLGELTDLLRGSGVTVTGGTLPEGACALPGCAELSEQISLEQLMERINGWYEQVMAVVTASGAVWSALLTRVDLLAAEVKRVQSLAESVGVTAGAHTAGDDLERLVLDLAQLRAEVVADPLAFWVPARGRVRGRADADREREGRSGSRAEHGKAREESAAALRATSATQPGGTPWHATPRALSARPLSRDGSPGCPDTRRYDRAERELEDIRREVEAVLYVRDDAEHRLLRLRDVLSRADRTFTEARGARGEVLAKIAASEVPAVRGPAAALREQLATAVEYSRSGQWHRLSPLLDGLEQQADKELDRARASLTAVTAPLAVRAELRGRLDAYKAKAARQRHGTADDPLLVERYDQARRLLWSAPCDLKAAERAVLRYQQVVMEVVAPGQAGPEHRQGEGVSG